jgi:ABC-2 type transport system permease protein
MTESPAQTSASTLTANAAYRTTRLGACISLYWLTLKQHLHGKRWIALVALFLLPAGLAAIIRATQSSVPSLTLEFALSWILIPQAVLPLVALLYASGVIQDEQEEQTLTYLLIRPIPKWLIYIVKMLANWTTTVLLVIVLITLTFAAVYINRGAELSEVAQRCIRTCAIDALAVIAYCSLFGLIGLLTRRTLIIGVVYTAVVEGLLANLPLSVRMGTVIYYARVIAYRTMDFVVTWPQGNKDDIAASTWQLNIATDPALAEHPSVRTCVIVLAGASVVCTLIAAWLCSPREFHVKTPEKE